MKFKNKLLPFIGIAATVATATPLALTSCKSSTQTIELIDITDGSKAVPTIKPMTSLESMGEKEFTKAYVQAVKNNPEIFKQDFLYGVFINSLDDELSEKVKFNYIKAGCTTPTFGAVNISYPGEPDVQYPTISFSYSIQYSKEELIIDSGHYLDKSDIFSVNVTVENVPWYISSSSYSPDPDVYKTVYWVDWPGMDDSRPYIWQYNLNPWSIDYSYSLDETTIEFTSSGKDITTKNKADSGKMSTFKDIIGNGELLALELNWGFYSHHLSEIIPAPEFKTKAIYAGTTFNPLLAEHSKGLEKLSHGDTLGLYLPSDTLSTRYPAKQLSISMFEKYDDKGNKVPLQLTQVLDEGATETPLLIEFSSDKQAYSAAGSTGWNGEVVPYDGSSYIPYLFPEGKIYDSETMEETTLKPTSEEKGVETFKFRLPKSLIIQFEYRDSEEPERPFIWDQEVWLSQDKMSLIVDFE